MKADLESEFPDTKVETVACSVTGCANMTQVMQEAGDIDIVVHRAAAPNQHGPLLESKTEYVSEMFETNVIASFDLMKIYLDLAPPATGTRTVINETSGSAHCYVPQHAIMAASKAAFAEMLSFLTDELTTDKDHVRIFSIHPGIVYTPNVESSYQKDSVEWEDIKLPGDFCVWLARSEADFLHRRFIWAQLDVDELIASVKERVKTDPFYLKIKLMQRNN